MDAAQKGSAEAAAAASGVDLSWWQLFFIEWMMNNQGLS